MCETRGRHVTLRGGFVVAALAAVVSLTGTPGTPGVPVARAQNVAAVDPRVDALANQLRDTQATLKATIADLTAVRQDYAAFKTQTNARLYRIESNLLPFDPTPTPTPTPTPGPVPPKVPTGPVWAVLVRPDPPTDADVTLRKSPALRGALNTTGAAWQSYLATEPEMQTPAWQSWVKQAGGPPCVLWVRPGANGKGEVFWTTPQPDETKVLNTYKAIRGQ